MLEVGRVCVKTAGREAGRPCVVVKKLDENYLLVTGPKELTGVRRRKCNVVHLEPTPETLKIKSDAADSDVMKVFRGSETLKKLGTAAPTPAELKKRKELRAKKEAAKKELEKRKTLEEARRKEEERKAAEEERRLREKEEKEKAKAREKELKRAEKAEKKAEPEPEKPKPKPARKPKKK